MMPTDLHKLARGEGSVFICSPVDGRRTHRVFVFAGSLGSVTGSVLSVTRGAEAMEGRVVGTCFCLRKHSVVRRRLLEG